MTNKKRLQNAINELTCSTGPDRAIDGVIAVAINPTREVILYNEPGPFPQKAVRGPVSELNLTGRDLAEYISAPAFTSSYDDAMSLANAESSRRFEFGSHGDGDSWAYVHLHGGAGGDNDVVGESEACCNEPTAITAAILAAHIIRLEAQAQEEVA